MQALMLVLPIILLVLVGWLVVRFGILQARDARVLTRFFMYVTGPALLIETTAKEDLSNLIQFRFVTATIAIYLLIYALVFCVEKFFLRRDLGVAAFAAFAAAKFNVVIVALPVLLVTVGHVAVGSAVVNLIIGYALIVPLTLAMHGYQEGKAGHTRRSPALTAALEAATNPLLIGTAIGIIISAFGVVIPAIPAKILSLLGAATIPVALVALGMTISLTAIIRQKGEIFWITGVRLILSPALALLFALGLELPPVQSVMLVVMFSIPTAKMVFVLCEEYGTYAEESAGIVTVSTLASAISIPVWIWVAHDFWPSGFLSH